MGRVIPIKGTRKQPQPTSGNRVRRPLLKNHEFPDYIGNTGPGLVSDRERYGEIDLTAPFDEWVGVVSTWVERIRFNPHRDALGIPLDRGDLFVEFLSGAMVEYEKLGLDLWHDFVNSSSKGMFVHFRLYDLPYNLIHGSSRQVTREMKRARDKYGRLSPWRPEAQAA